MDAINSKALSHRSTPDWLELSVKFTYLLALALSPTAIIFP